MSWFQALLYGFTVEDRAQTRAQHSQQTDPLSHGVAVAIPRLLLQGDDAASRNSLLEIPPGLLAVRALGCCRGVDIDHLHRLGGSRAGLAEGQRHGQGQGKARRSRASAATWQASTPYHVGLDLPQLFP